MNGQTFIDGVGEIRLRDGVVRMDLLSLSPIRRTEEGEPQPEFVEQLVMSPEAFMRMVRALSATVEQMRDGGLLRAPEAGETGEKGAGEETDGQASSPNFS